MPITIAIEKIAEMQHFLRDSGNIHTSEEAASIVAINLVRTLNEIIEDNNNLTEYADRRQYKYLVDELNIIKELRNKVTHDHRNVKYNDIQDFINNLQKNLQDPAQIRDTALFNKLVNSTTQDSKGVYDAKLVQFVTTNQEGAYRSAHEPALNYWYAKQLVEISTHIPINYKSSTKEDMYYAVMYWELLTQLSNSSSGITFLRKLQIPEVHSRGRDNVLHSFSTNNLLQKTEIINAQSHIQLYIKVLDKYCNTVESQKDQTILNCAKLAIQRYDKNRSRLYPTPSIKFDPPNLPSSSKETRVFGDEKSRLLERKYNENSQERQKKIPNIQYEIENNPELIRIRTQILNQDFSKRKIIKKESEFEELWDKLPNHLKNKETIESLENFISKMHKDIDKDSSRHTLLSNWKMKLSQNLQSSHGKVLFSSENAASDVIEINKKLLTIHKNEMKNYSDTIRQFYQSNSSEKIDQNQRINDRSPPTIPETNENMDINEIIRILSNYKKSIIKYKNDFLESVGNKNGAEGIKKMYEELILELPPLEIQLLPTNRSSDSFSSESISDSLLEEEEKNERTSMNKQLLKMRANYLTRYKDSIENLYKKYSDDNPLERKEKIAYRHPPANLVLIDNLQTTMSVEEINEKLDKYNKEINQYKNNFLADIDIIKNNTTKNAIIRTVISLIPEKIKLISLLKEQKMEQSKTKKRKKDHVVEQQVNLQNLKNELIRRNDYLNSIDKSHSDYKNLQSEYNKLLYSYKIQKANLIPSSYNQSVRSARGSPLHQAQQPAAKQLLSRSNAPTTENRMKKLKN